MSHPLGLLLATASAPAAGAALTQIVEASLVFAAVLGGLGWATVGLRRGRATRLSAAAAKLGARTGAPAWAALPLIALPVALLVALFGMLWVF